MPDDDRTITVRFDEIAADGVVTSGELAEDLDRILDAFSAGDIDDLAVTSGGRIVAMLQPMSDDDLVRAALVRERAASGDE